MWFLFNREDCIDELLVSSVSLKQRISEIAERSGFKAASINTHFLGGRIEVCYSTPHLSPFLILTSFFIGWSGSWRSRQWFWSKGALPRSGQYHFNWGCRGWFSSCQFTHGQCRGWDVSMMVRISVKLLQWYPVFTHTWTHLPHPAGTHHQSTPLTAQAP